MKTKTSKKFMALLVSMVLILCMVGCSSEEKKPKPTPTEPIVSAQPTAEVTDTPTDEVTPEVTEEPTITEEPTVTEEPTITEEPIVTVEPTEDITIEKLNASILQKFEGFTKENGNIAIDTYMSETVDSFDTENIMMSMAISPKGTYSYLPGYAKLWTIDNVIYYFDENDSTWYKSTTADANNTDLPDNTIENLKNSLIPETAEIKNVTINGVDYIAASYVENGAVENTEDTNIELPESLIMYCFTNVDGNLDLALVVNQTSEVGYIFMVLDMSEIEIPAELETATDGDFEAYLTAKFMSLLETSEDGLIEDIEGNTEDVVVEENTDEITPEVTDEVVEESTDEVVTEVPEVTENSEVTETVENTTENTETVE